MIVECVAPDLIHPIWDRVRPMIDAGYEPGDDLMPEDMLERLSSGLVQLWIAIDEGGKIHAAMTTELVPMRSGLVCWMCQCSGENMKDWSSFHTKVENYARVEGCVKVAMRGRSGWQHVLEGYKVRTVQLEKVLYDE